MYRAEMASRRTVWLPATGRVPFSAREPTPALRAVWTGMMAWRPFQVTVSFSNNSRAMTSWVSCSWTGVRKKSLRIPARVPLETSVVVMAPRVAGMNRSPCRGLAYRPRNARALAAPSLMVLGGPSDCPGAAAPDGAPPPP